MYAQSRLLSSLVLGVVFIAFLPVMFFIKRSRDLNQNRQLLNKSIVELIVEVVENIKLIYGYNLQNSSVEKFNTISSQLSIAANLASANRSIFSRIITCIISISLTLIIWAGAGQILNMQITSGSLVAFIIYALIGVSSLVGVLANVSEIQPQCDKLANLLELINQRVEAKEYKINTLSYITPFYSLYKHSFYQDFTRKRKLIS
jgi:ABC-type bacteriocin/lantibiotic exporter with double-glycine peptidase domain